MTSLFIIMGVIRCPVNAGLNFHGIKLSRMAVEPQKPRKFSTTKIKVRASKWYSEMASLTVCHTSGPDFNYLPGENALNLPDRCDRKNGGLISWTRRLYQL